MEASLLMPASSSTLPDSASSSAVADAVLIMPSTATSSSSSTSSLPPSHTTTINAAAADTTPATTPATSMTITASASSSSHDHAVSTAAATATAATAVAAVDAEITLRHTELPPYTEILTVTNTQLLAEYDGLVEAILAMDSVEASVADQRALIANLDARIDRAKDAIRDLDRKKATTVVGVAAFKKKPSPNDKESLTARRDAAVKESSTAENLRTSAFAHLSKLNMRLADLISYRNRVASILEDLFRTLNDPVERDRHSVVIQGIRSVCEQSDKCVTLVRCIEHLNQANVRFAATNSFSADHVVGSAHFSRALALWPELADQCLPNQFSTILPSHANANLYTIMSACLELALLRKKELFQSIAAEISTLISHTARFHNWRVLAAESALNNTTTTAAAAAARPEPTASRRGMDISRIFNAIFVWNPQPLENMLHALNNAVVIQPADLAAALSFALQE